MTIGPIDHVGIVVRSIDEALLRYRALFELEPDAPVMHVVAQGVRICFLATGQGAAARLELLEPVQAGTGIARFLEQRGEGLHHVCFGTGSIVADLASLEAHGAELIDREPRPGADGLVAFIHPRTLSGVLWELRQGEAEAETEGAPQSKP